MKKILLAGILSLTSLFSMDFDSELNTTLKELKKTLPYEISPYAIWESIEKKDKVIEYTFLLKQKEFKGFKKNEIDAIIQKQCNNKMSKAMLSNDYTLKLNYKNYTEVIVQDFTINKTDCGYKN